MGYWSERVLPKLIDRGMRNDFMNDHRGRAAPLASGRVLELGAGSGLNFPHYGSNVEHLFALEPSEWLIDKAGELAEQAEFPIEFLQASAEDIPLERDEIDTVVSSWTLCSVPDLERTLQEVRRVLKPDGRLIFIEHGRAPDANIARWQDRLVPISRPLLGCSLNRAKDDLIGDAGFRMLDFEKGYFEGPKIIAYHYVGQAQPA